MKLLRHSAHQTWLYVATVPCNSGENLTACQTRSLSKVKQ